ncbi:MAG: sigma-54-dependent Fis family transcriptional regulator [Deltaproteobacteria bacterium]|nr:sigma-54-dependent Fis family transcriptional regulator [Deltaproteobacteria bacterium]
MHKFKIVIVDDEKDMREFLEIMLRKEGYEVIAFSSAGPALDWCKTNDYDLVITDLKMPGMDGVSFLKTLREANPEALVIMITAYASVETAIEAMKAGAYDYFTKPFNVVEVKHNIKNALRLKHLERENRLLKDELKGRTGFGDLIGGSPRMLETYKLIMSVAKSKTNIFITGESGTGKELAARAIHNESDRKDEPFVALNCGAIPENLLESELFGHQKGAFTGAVSNKEGLVERADNGTLFLDEVTEMPVHLQVKILRFIQERNFRRVGGTADISVDIRLIAASNRDVEDEVRTGRFREDLFYRLNVIRLKLPPLRERKEDIPALTRHFLEKYNKSAGKNIKGFSEEAMRFLLDYGYSGNVRELENIIEHAVTLENSDSVVMGSIPSYLTEKANAGVSGRAQRHFRAQTNITAQTHKSESGAERANGAEAQGVIAVLPDVLNGVIPRKDVFDLEKTVVEFEKTAILDALKKTGGAKKKAAELLGLSFRSMRYKLSKYGITEDR